MIQEVPDDFLLSDFGSSVTAGAVVGLGIMDRVSQIIMGDQVITVDYALTVRTDLFGGLQYGATVQHEGQTYRLRHEPLKLSDGRFCVMLLEKVEAALDEIGLIFADTIIRLNTIIRAVP
jgi:hypothetical protein